jgi:hypothetical protein
VRRPFVICHSCSPRAIRKTFSYLFFPRQARQSTSSPTCHAKPSPLGPTVNVTPDNPRQARPSPSSPTNHVRPDNTRQARPTTSSPTCHAKPSPLGPTIPVKPDLPRQARQSTSSPTTTSGPTNHVKPDQPRQAQHAMRSQPCQARPTTSGPTNHVKSELTRQARQSMRSHPRQARPYHVRPNMPCEAIPVRPDNPGQARAYTSAPLFCKVQVRKALIQHRYVPHSWRLRLCHQCCVEAGVSDPTVPRDAAHGHRGRLQAPIQSTVWCL